MGHKVIRQIKAGKMDAVAVTLDRIKKRPRNALDRVDAQRIHGRVNIDGAAQVFGVPLQLLI